MSIVLRDLRTLEDYHRVVDLEQEIWSYADLRDAVTVPVFIITGRRGGILIGAFVEEEMVGFAFSLVGMKGGQPMQWSHMLGVLPAYRTRGVGRALKLAQRERAIADGYQLMEWTFDPLQAPNAHLNFRLLGVVSDEYARDFYGSSTSTLHRGTATDRLVVQWRLREAHVVRRVARASDALEIRDADVLAAPVINETRADGEFERPLSSDLARDERRLWLQVPARFAAMQREAPELAVSWRAHTRELFEQYLARGYRLVDFDRSACRYLLSKD